MHDLLGVVPQLEKYSFWLSEVKKLTECSHLPTEVGISTPLTPAHTSTFRLEETIIKN